MNIPYQVEQVAYWLDQNETVKSMKGKKLIKELTDEEIDTVAAAYREYKQKFQREPKPQPSKTGLLVGILFIISGIIGGMIVGSLMVAMFSVMVGALRLMQYFYMQEEVSKEEDDQDYNIGRSQLLDKLAVELQAARQAG